MTRLCFLDAKLRLWVIVVGDDGRKVGLYLLWSSNPCPLDFGRILWNEMEATFKLLDARELMGLKIAFVGLFSENLG
jgi:hypothetical protein